MSVSDKLLTYLFATRLPYAHE